MKDYQQVEQLLIDLESYEDPLSPLSEASPEKNIFVLLEKKRELSVEIHSVFWYGNLKIAQLLLEHRAVDNLENALTLTCQMGHLELARLLLKYGAKITDSMLFFAIKGNHFEILKFLLDNGANVNAGNDYCLRYASTYGKLEFVKLLIRYGANLQAKKNASLHLARENRHFEIVKELLFVPAISNFFATIADEKYLDTNSIK